MSNPKDFAMIASSEWRSAMGRHRQVLDPIINPYLDQRSRGGKDPILDFLFEYYAFRPSHLLKWSPGVGVRLAGCPAATNVDRRYLHVDPSGFSVSADSFPEKRITGLQWTIDLLRKTSAREPAYGCHGLHEWAMIYKSDDVRHRHFPLRLGPEKTNDVVRESKLLCSHFDAYRFFSPEATHLNRKALSREQMSRHEQPGCLHTNMDLYKWSTKFFPWISSATIRSAFLLALDIREVDMRASPYDLSELGLQPICIEEDTGRTEYRQHQVRFFARAASLRIDLIEKLDFLYSSTRRQEIADV